MNLQNDINDEQTKYLIALNRKLARAQEQLMEFLNFLNYVVSLKNLNKLSAMGTVTLVCFTGADNYPYIPNNKESQKTFHRQRFVVEDLLKSDKSYAITDRVNTPAGMDILAPLTEDFLSERFSFLFFNLLSNGLLAISDLLNISGIEVILNTSFGCGEEKFFLNTVS